MSDSEKPPFPIEAEKTDLEKVDTSSGDNKVDDKSGIEFERAQLLANLPDPDAGKSEEERRSIVSCLISALHPRKCSDWLAGTGQDAYVEG
jgi:hypothetical protein